MALSPSISPKLHCSQVSSCASAVQSKYVRRYLKGDNIAPHDDDVVEAYTQEEITQRMEEAGGDAATVCRCGLSDGSWDRKIAMIFYLNKKCVLFRHVSTTLSVGMVGSRARVSRWPAGGPSDRRADTPALQSTRAVYSAKNALRGIPRSSGRFGCDCCACGRCLLSGNIQGSAFLGGGSLNVTTLSTTKIPKTLNNHVCVNLYSHIELAHCGERLACTAFITE